MKVGAHLEHHQVVVMPLYLEDAGQSHHSCFEIWRITWKRGKQAMMSSFTWDGSMTTSKKRADGGGVSPYCQGWWGGPLLWRYRRLPAVHISCTSPLSRDTKHAVRNTFIKQIKLQRKISQFSTFSVRFFPSWTHWQWRQVDCWAGNIIKHSSVNVSI